MMMSASSRNSVPSADLALNLNVSLETLLAINNPKDSNDKQTEQNQLHLYRKYHDLIEKYGRFFRKKAKPREHISKQFSRHINLTFKKEQSQFNLGIPPTLF